MDILTWLKFKSGIEQLGLAKKLEVVCPVPISKQWMPCGLCTQMSFLWLILANSLGIIHYFKNKIIKKVKKQTWREVGFFPVLSKHNSWGWFLKFSVSVLRLVRITEVRKQNASTAWRPEHRTPVNYPVCKATSDFRLQSLLFYTFSMQSFIIFFGVITC